MNSILGLRALAPVLQEVASWLEQRRLGRQAAQLDSLPNYLLTDVGLPRLHDPAEVARETAVLEALRRF